MNISAHLSRRGLTLIETIVAITIIGILAAILIPAVQAVRESARRTQCQNNLKQTALAVHAFHNTTGALPSLYNGTSLSYPLTEWDLFHTHSYRVVLLPYIEQQSLRDSVVWESLATERDNESVATTVVSTYVCPSGASPSAVLGWGLRHGSLTVPKEDQTDADKYRVVRSDYDAMAGALVIPDTQSPGANSHNLNNVRWSVWGWPVFSNNAISAGNLIRYRAGRFADISDGLSNTIMLVERGGRPFHMVDGKRHVTEHNPNADPGGQVGWSASNTFLWAVNGHNIGINHDNNAGIYSTHAGGAFVSFADGSVTFLNESTNTTTLAQMFGRSDGAR